MTSRVIEPRKQTKSPEPTRSSPADGHGAPTDNLEHCSGILLSLESHREVVRVTHDVHLAVRMLLPP